MSIQVKISKGKYRGLPVEGIFPMVKPWQDGAKGGFVTIRNDNAAHGTPDVQRVTCKKEDCVLQDAEGNALPEHTVVEATKGGNGDVVLSTNFEAAFVSTETEEEAMERIAETFLMLDEITSSCAKGDVRGLVVVGPPGIGKSFGVEKQLQVENMFRTIEGRDPKFEIVSGGTSAIGLYQKLYHNRDPENVLVFDDCDGILFEEESLNLLKAALNSGEKRRICWNKESRVLNTDDIPDAFDFEASIIFLSNIDFERTIARGSRISEHLRAIMSRCHYLDLEIGSVRDKMLRIKQIVRDGMLQPYSFTEEQEQEIVEYVQSNAEFLRELSLRMVKKIADFVHTNPTGWKRLTEATCMTKEAKFKRLLEKKSAEAAKQGIALAETV